MIAMIGQAAKGAPQPRAPDAAGLEQCLTLVIGQFDQTITNVLGDRCMLFGTSSIRSSLSRFRDARSVQRDDRSNEECLDRA